MKRSEINKLMEMAVSFFSKHQFYLPSWALKDPKYWKGKYNTHAEIINNLLGWDLTDFGSNDFSKRGLLLFTIRNGSIKKDKKNYCEKIMIVDVNQETPMHFHQNKMEDIINRSGGILAIQFYNSNADRSLSDKNLIIKIDGQEVKLNAGETIHLQPGQSVCMEPGVYHRFYGIEAPVLVGEVSTVNDDSNDNFFYEPIGRFPEIEEDERPLYLLANDYMKYI